MSDTTARASLSTVSAHVHGVVQRYDPIKRYGFLRRTDATSRDADIFVHRADIVPEPSGERTLTVGDAVVFDVVRDAATGKIRATNVVRLALDSPYAP